VELRIMKIHPPSTAPYLSNTFSTNLRFLYVSSSVLRLCRNSYKDELEKQFV
jgi:hypothetical protein